MVGKALEKPASRYVFTAERALEAALDGFACAHPELREDLEQVLFSWPNLADVIRRAAFFVSPGLPCGEDDPRALMIAALKAGVVASQRLAGCESYAPFLDAFLRILSDGFASMSVYGLSTDGSQDRWEMCGPNICQWAAGFDTIVVMGVEPSEEIRKASELLLSARILTTQDLALKLGAPPLLFPSANRGWL